MGQKRSNHVSSSQKTNVVMTELLQFIIKKITGSEDFDVEEAQEEGKTLLTVHANKDIIGLIIGKGGKTIKNIRKILSVKATLEDKAVNISVLEK